MFIEKLNKFRQHLKESRKGDMGWYGLIIGGAMAVLGLVLLGLIAAIGTILLVTFQTNSVAGYGNNTAMTGPINGTVGNATAGITAVAQQMPLIGLVIAFALILIILIGAVMVVVGGVRGRGDS